MSTSSPELKQKTARTGRAVLRGWLDTGLTGYTERQQFGIMIEPENGKHGKCCIKGNQRNFVKYISEVDLGLRSDQVDFFCDFTSITIC